MKKVNEGRGRDSNPTWTSLTDVALTNEDSLYSLRQRLIGGGVLPALPTFSKSQQHAPVPISDI